MQLTVSPPEDPRTGGMGICNLYYTHPTAQSVHDTPSNGVLARNAVCNSPDSL